MSAALDRREELARMKEQGELCMAVAQQRRDKPGFLRWQSCVSQIDRMLVSASRASD